MGAAEAVVGLYDRHAGAWAAARGEGVAERGWLGRFRGAMPGARVLDVGCGTGMPVAAWLAGRGCRVTGVDAAPGMLARARVLLPEQLWIAADMRELALGETFDGVLAWCSLFHLTPDDQRRALPLLAAHAGPGAALMFTSGTEEGEALGAFGGEVLYHGSLSSAEYRATLEGLGFKILDHRVRDPDCGGLTIWLARRIALDRG